MTRQLIYTTLVALFIVVFIISVSSTEKFTVEGFSTKYNYMVNPYLRYNFRYPNKYYRYCRGCEKKSPYSCKNCVNCGLCYSLNGDVKCVPGDRAGPYFSEQCQYWNY